MALDSPCTEKIKLGILTSSVSRNAGGLYNSVRQLALQLHHSAKIDIQVFGLADEYTSKDLSKWGKIPVQAFNISGPLSLGYAPTLRQALHDADLDLYHAHGIWTYPSLAGLQWAKQTKKPYLISPRGMLDAWALQNSRWKKRLISRLYENAHLQGATCLHALCESEARSIRAYGLQNPICVIPNGVFLPPESKPVATQWEVPDDAKVLLYLGRLHPKKGLLNLLYAWDMNHDWYLVIAGWDQNGHENELKMLCRKLGIQDRVIFAGPQFNTDKHASYSRANAFILPSFSEGLPMVILEAWSYGLPVLMTPHCNLPEGVGAAIEVEANQESIAQGLNALFLMSDNERQTLGLCGRKLVAEQFTWPKIAAEMRSVYEWILGGGSPPSSVITD